MLHLYVDSLFVSKPDATREDYQALAEMVERATHLPMDFDGTVYPWFAFLAARANANLGVANRFYGLSPDGEHKIRGIALRRGDTPLFIANTQMKVLSILAKESDPTRLTDLLPEVFTVVQEQLAALKQGEVPLEELVVTLTLSREPEKYSVLSPSAVVAKQLQAQGKIVKRGQRIRFIYIAPAPGVWAWDAPIDPNSKAVDRRKYREILIRAIQEVLQPLGMTETTLNNWLIGRVGYLAQRGLFETTNPTKTALPLFAGVKYLRVDS